MAEKKNDKKSKVFVAMSGGVDSSVATALLKESGEFDVIGAHMVCWKDNVGHPTSDNGCPTSDNGCSAERDAEDARRVADKLGISFYVFDFSKEYRETVFDYMVREYKAGRTPNPDVMCNREIKFGIFLKKALELGADYVATGHYSRIMNSESGIKLLEAKDKNKDQSYFLWTLTQERLSHALFPIGAYTKNEVRELAKKFNLPTAEKKDSQGLCFVGNVDFASFLRKYIKPHRGKVVTTKGEEIGEHDGVEFYTIGQRHGLKIGGGTPYFVVGRDKKNNILTVADSEEDPSLFRKEITIGDINWISGAMPDLSREYLARVRYRQPLQRCYLNHLETGSPSGVENLATKLIIVFDEPQRAIAEGQSLVLYDGKEMLGGGVILP